MPDIHACPVESCMACAAQPSVNSVSQHRAASFAWFRSIFAAENRQRHGRSVHGVMVQPM